MPTDVASNDILVLGIGNTLMGDDGAGIRVVEMLANRELPTGVEIQEVGLPGWGLPSWFEGRSNVILVDAMQMGQTPGCWKRYRPEDLKILMEDHALSLHQPDLSCGLCLSQALDCLPQNLHIYGIEPAETVIGAALSDEVSACLPEVVDSILNDVKRIKE